MNTSVATHEAVRFASPLDLAGRLVPRVKAAIDAGETVVASLDVAHGDAVRDALGAGAGSVEFLDPEQVHRVPAFTVAVRWARLTRRVTAAGGRTTVVGQYLPDLPGCDAGHWERLDIALNVALAGLPITMLCAYPAGPAMQSFLTATHPGPLDGSALGPGRRAPEELLVDYPPPPPPDLGPPAAELTFATATLPELRHLVAGVAARAGLDGERVGEVVLAVNELASNSIEHGPGGGRLRLWTAPDAARHALVAEVSDTGRIVVPFPGMAAPSPSGPRGRGLWLASELTDVMQVWSGEAGTVIRLQVDLPG